MTLFKPESDEPLSGHADLVDKVRSLLRLEHLMRYGIDAVDERWLQRLSDEQLRGILETHHASNPQYIY